MGTWPYCTDTNEISATSMALLRGLDTLVLDALRPTRHATHFSIDEAVAYSGGVETTPNVFYSLFLSH